MWVWLELIPGKTDREWNTHLECIANVSKRSYWWCWPNLLSLGWACKCILVFAWIIFLWWSVGWWAELHHIFYSPSAWSITKLLTWSLTCDVLPCPRRKTVTLFLPMQTKPQPICEEYHCLQCFCPSITCEVGHLQAKLHHFGHHCLHVYCFLLLSRFRFSIDFFASSKLWTIPHTVFCQQPSRHICLGL